MDKFSGPLTVTKLYSGMWKVEKDFTFSSDSNKGEVIFIPSGFETDFASVPRGLWNLYPPDGQYSQAAVVHDYLYHEQSFARSKCDNIFKEAMKELKVSFIDRNLIWSAVRSFGWLCWKKRKEGGE